MTAIFGTCRIKRLPVEIKRIIPPGSDQPLEINMASGEKTAKAGQHGTKDFVSESLWDLLFVLLILPFY